MRHFIAIGVCSAALLLTGCPGGQQPGTAPPPVAVKAKPPVAAPQPRKYPLELNGVRLGLSYDDAHALIKQQGSPKVTSRWTEVGKTGVLSVLPSSGANQPADDYYFDQGLLVGYFKRFLIDDETYVKTVDQLAVTFDPAVTTPPAWVAGDAFVKALPTLQPPDGELFWQDEARREVLAIEHHKDNNQAIACLFQPEPCERLGLSYPELMKAFEDKPEK